MHYARLVSPVCRIAGAARPSGADLYQADVEVTSYVQGASRERRASFLFRAAPPISGRMAVAGEILHQSRLYAFDPAIVQVPPGAFDGAFSRERAGETAFGTLCSSKFVTPFQPSATVLSTLPLKDRVALATFDEFIGYGDRKAIDFAKAGVLSALLDPGDAKGLASAQSSGGASSADFGNGLLSDSFVDSLSVEDRRQAVILAAACAERLLTLNFQAILGALQGGDDVLGMNAAELQKLLDFLLARRPVVHPQVCHRLRMPQLQGLTSPVPR
jgi:hypothetical protein